MSATLILPVGPPGCGKSSLAKELLRLSLIDNDAIVCPDTYRRILTGNRACQNSNGAVFGVCNEITRARLRNGLPVFFDATNLTTLADFRIMGTALNANVLSVPLSVDWNELLIRNGSRLDPVPKDVLERMYGKYAALRPLDMPGKVVAVDDLLRMTTF